MVDVVDGDDAATTQSEQAPPIDRDWYARLPPLDLSVLTLDSNEEEETTLDGKSAVMNKTVSVCVYGPCVYTKQLYTYAGTRANNIGC